MRERGRKERFGRTSRLGKKKGRVGWRKKKMNEGRGREEHEILCFKRALKSEV